MGKGDGSRRGPFEIGGSKRDVLNHHLALAEKRIVEGAVHVEQQRQIVEGLKRRGQDFRRSADLLELFKETLAEHVRERDRLLEVLAEHF